MYVYKSSQSSRSYECRGLIWGNCTYSCNTKYCIRPFGLIQIIEMSVVSFFYSVNIFFCYVNTEQMLQVSLQYKLYFDKIVTWIHIQLVQVPSCHILQYGIDTQGSIANTGAGMSASLMETEVRGESGWSDLRASLASSAIQPGWMKLGCQVESPLRGLRSPQRGPTPSTPKHKKHKGPQTV